MNTLPPLSITGPSTGLGLAWLMALPVWVLLGLLLGPQLRAPTQLTALLSLVLLQPLLEELVFRGLLQGVALRLLRRQGRVLRCGPVSLANLLVTAAFVALHLVVQPLPWALAVALPSLVLGHLREHCQSLGPVILTHAYYNAGFALTAVLAGPA